MTWCTDRIRYDRRV